MTKLDQLLKDLCPEGVEYRSIGSLIVKISDKAKNNPDISQVYAVSNTLGMVKAEEFREHTVHSEDISNYTVVRQYNFAYNPSRLNIGSIAMLKNDEPGLVSPMYVVFSIDEKVILPEFLECNVKSSYVKQRIDSLKEEGARFRFDFNRWNSILIPIPPIEVQQEIVRILDNYTKLIEELNAELDARKRQYEYYRDKLLTFESEAGGQKTNVRWAALGDIATIKTGFKPEEIYEEYMPGMVEYINAGTTNSGYVLSYNCEGDTVTTPSRGQGGIGFVGYQKDNFWLGPLCYKIKSNGNLINNRYLYFILCSKKEELLKMKKEGGIPALNAGDLANLQIPVPSIEEQKRIISVLDRFDALCNDISSGLPAEIEGRRRQYEYYRDKLLSFKEM